MNAPWHWHFVPGDWKLSQINMEVCDGQPRYVEEHLEEWLAQVGRYCPWSSIVVAER